MAEMIKKYRLYIDETGNSDLESSDNPNHRFLSLSGIAIDLEYVQSTVSPKLEELKREFFRSHPDEPVILHRKDMVNQRHPFGCLSDKTIRMKFDNALLDLLQNFDFTIFSVLVDKREYKQLYTTWQYDPYHYCLMILIERYVRFLGDKQSKGDVMVESRGGKDDRRLKDSFERLMQKGTDYISSEEFLSRLTSRQLKVKAKASNIAGLQIADLLAHPSRREILIEEKLIQDQREDIFSTQISALLQSKYYQKYGRIKGYGKKKLP